MLFEYSGSKEDGEGDIILRLLNKLDYSEKYSIMSLN